MFSMCRHFCSVVYFAKKQGISHSAKSHNHSASIYVGVGAEHSVLYNLNQMLTKILMTLKKKPYSRVKDMLNSHRNNKKS